MRRFFVIRKIDNVEVLIMKIKNENKYKFVNLSRGHICPCIFDSEEDAIDDLRKYKESGKIIDFYEV